MNNYNNSGMQVQQKPKFSVAITTPGYQKMINNTLGDPNRAKKFIATITSAVAVNPALQECKASSILAGALLGESLNLSPSPQLGQFYLVPFNNRKEGTKEAQFILGYKGYIQLAQRSGAVQKLDAVSIKEGELKHFDPIKGEYEFTPINDFEQRNITKTVGYYAYFKLGNGYLKEMYWSKEQMERHADQYSKAFSIQSYHDIQDGKIPDKDMWKYSSFWYKNFDSMAEKTMLRQLISKGGCPMSTEMIKAFESDNAVVTMDKDCNFVTAPEEQETPVIEAQNQTPEKPQQAEKQEVESVNIDEL